MGIKIYINEKSGFPFVMNSWKGLALHLLKRLHFDWRVEKDIKED